MKFVRLQCDYMKNPIGFDFDRPVLLWVVEDDGADKGQSAFRVQIATDPQFLNIVLDTGKTASDVSNGFRPELTLEPCTKYYWRVNVWDEKDCETGFSAPAEFETARYGQAWKAEWIGADCQYAQLRKGFSIDKKVVKARAYASGVGLYRMFINGKPVSEELLTPGINAYDLWIQYQTYDVTELFTAGTNVVGAWLGNGFYSGRCNWPEIPTRRHLYGDENGFIAEIVLEYEDGTKETLLTDPTWEAMPSPYDRAEIYDGEIFDARKFDPDWCKKTDSSSARAKVLTIDKALLHARKSVPVKAMHELTVQEKLLTPAGEQVFDFGQNIAGRIRVTIDLPKDAEVLFQFGEMLDKDGNFYRENMRTALEEARFISDGKPYTYAANFTFHGFRYVKVTGAEFSADQITAEAIYSEMDTTGSFECSDPRVNRLFLNALWSQRDNFVDVPTDCPQRDERMGWTGDAQVFAPTACMNMASDAFFRKYLYDLKLEQKKCGYVPVVIPFLILGTGIWEFPTTGWGDVAVLLPWDLYNYYGDKAVLEEQYESAKQWVDYMTEQDADGSHLYQGFHIGDWVAQDTRDPDNLFGLTPTTLLATAYYAWSAELVSRMAGVLGKDADQKSYHELSETVKEAFRREFVSETGRVSAETQTAYLIALNMEMLKPEQVGKAVACLAERIETDNIQLTTGFLGTPYLCPVLSEYGLNEYAYALLLQNKCPSWLYEVENGATTIWERWNSRKPDGSFGPVSMNSFNHYAFGAVCEWLYRYVSGIQTDEAAPGYKKILIRPRINSQLTHAGASIDTVHGTVESKWAIDGDRITVSVRIPFNTTATIMLPDAEGALITENGAAVTADASEEGCAVFHRGSGRYTYTYTATMETISKRVVIKPLPKF